MNNVEVCIVRHSQFQPKKTNCVFRTFRVEESFWTKKQSCKLLKVDLKKWRPFFVFVRFNGRHFLNHKKSRNLADRIFSLYFRKLSVEYHRDNIQKLEIVISLNSFFFFQSTVVRTVHTFHCTYM